MRFFWLVAFLAALAGCGSAPPPVEDDAPVQAEETLAPQTATQAKEAARRRRRPSYSEARERAEEKLKRLEAKRKKGEDVAARKSALAGDAVAQKYEALLELPGTPEMRKPEILLRLAEMAYQEEEGKLKDAYEAGTDMDILPGDRYPTSIGYYKRIAGSYPDSPQALVAFYNLGYLYSEEGERELSVRAYREVLRRDPSTAYAAEIHMRLGESAFDLGLYKEAIAHYESVLQGGRKEYFEKALYKLGWSHYKLDDYPTAVGVFSRIMDSGQPTADKLTEETIDIMGRAFVEWGGVESLARYLDGREPGKRYGDRLHKKLGDLYLEGSRHLDAVASYTRGLEAFPQSSQALVMEEAAITAWLALRDTESANTRRQLWYDLYRPGAAWDKSNGERLGKERDEMLEKGLRLAALYRHSRAQRGEGSLDAAILQYARYEELYGMRGEDGYEMAYSQAQALKEGGHHRDAARRYGDVAESSDFYSHREDASYRRIESLDALREEDPSVFDEFVAAHSRYAELNPNSETVPSILFSMGELTFGADRFAEARDAFRRVAEEFPGHELAPQAAERIARCYFREDRFAEAEEAARETLRRRPTEETRDQALKLISFSIFKQAETAEALADSAGSQAVPAEEAKAETAPAQAAPVEGAPAPAAQTVMALPTAEEAAAARNEAVKHFFRLAKEFPEGEAAQVALYRAAENLRKLGKEERAAAVYRQLAEKYRESRFAESALTLGSEILSSLGDWDGVGRNYEDLYRMEPEGPDAADHLFRALLAYEKAQMPPEAMALMEEFLTRFPQDGRLAQIIYRRAVMEDGAGLADKAAASYAAAWQAAAEGDESIYRARSALVLGEKELALFRTLELKGDMEAALMKKEESLERALGFLADAASLPFAETVTAALYYAGEAYEEMKTSLMESERPEGLTEEELEEYQFVLEERSFPLEEKAIDFYRKGVEAGRRAGVVNPWVEKMYARLEVLLPWAFQRAEETVEVWTPPPYPGRGWEVRP